MAVLLGTVTDSGQ